MTWFHWLLIGLISFVSLVGVAMIDRPREPMSRWVAIGDLVIAGLLIWGIVAFA